MLFTLIRFWNSSQKHRHEAFDLSVFHCIFYRQGRLNRLHRYTNPFEELLHWSETKRLFASTWPYRHSWCCCCPDLALLLLSQINDIGLRWYNNTEIHTANLWTVTMLKSSSHGTLSRCARQTSKDRSRPSLCEIRFEPTSAKRGSKSN